MPRGKKIKDFYFGDKQQKAVERYLLTEDIDERNKIFNETLKPAFTTMIESIIRSFNLFTPGEEFQETFDDTMSFLMTKINHYKPETNFKAYSYCGTICKRHLINKIKQYEKRVLRNESFDSESFDVNLNNNLKYSYEADKDKRDYLKALFDEIITSLQEMVNAPGSYKLKDNDIKVGRSLINLFNEWDNLFATMGTDKFNRSSIILYIQESTLLTAEEVKKSLTKFKTVYKQIKSNVADIYL